MTIRHAEEKDIPKIIQLLSEVLEIHAAIRPDIFRPGTTKYTPEALRAILCDETTPVFVAADETDCVLGYAFCRLLTQPQGGHMVPFTSLFIDDLCVEEASRGRHLGEALFTHVLEEARRLGCYEVTLNVWEGNDGARRFYEKMGMKPKETQMERIL